MSKAKGVLIGDEVHIPLARKGIPVEDGKWTVIDAADYDKVRDFKWHLAPERGRYYAKHSYRDESGKTKDIRLHRLIMDTPEGMDTDHADRDGLNNRRSNLRVCTRSENLQNRCGKVTARSRFKGISWDISREKWEARCRGKHIGRFETEIDAAEAYDNAAVEAFGSFARTNFDNNSCMENK